MADVNDVLLAASYDVAGRTVDIPQTTIFTVTSAGIYLCCLDFKTNSETGSNYTVAVNPFASLSNSGNTVDLNSLTSAYLIAGAIVSVSSGGNPPPTAINFDVHIRIVQVG